MIKEIHHQAITVKFPDMSALTAFKELYQTRTNSKMPEAWFRGTTLVNENSTDILSLYFTLVSDQGTRKIKPLMREGEYDRLLKRLSGRYKWFLVKRNPQ